MAENTILPVSKIPTGYENLFQKDYYLDEMNKQSVEEILTNVYDQARELYFGHKVTTFKLRELNYEKYDQLSAKKVETLLDRKGVLMDSFSAFCSMGSALVGDRNGQLLRSLASAATASSHHLSQVTQSKMEGYNHLYGMTGKEGDVLSARLQENDRQMEQLTTRIDQLVSQFYQAFVEAGRSSTG